MFGAKAIATDNHFSNSKYCTNAISLTASPSAPNKDRRAAIKQGLNKAKSYENVCKLLEIDFVAASTAKLEDLLPRWMERRRVILGLAENVEIAEAQVGP